MKFPFGTSSRPVGREIVINHLTRMQSGFICTAGIEPATGRHIRPVVRGAGLLPNLLAENRGLFEIGGVVQLGPTMPVGEPPHSEDFLFDPRKARRIRRVSAAELWQLLAKHARPKLKEIFGPGLAGRGPQSCALDQGKGRVSLGSLSPSRCGDLYVRRKAGKPGQVRMHVFDGEFDLDLGVTDLRLYGPDHQTPDLPKMDEISRRLREGAGVVLSVGLTRAYAPTAGTAPLHWLQVNNIHFRDRSV